MKKSGFSIKWQLPLVFILLVIITFVSAGAINSFFLEDYYIREKRNSIIEAYNAVNRAIANDTFVSDSFDKELENLCEKNSMEILIMNEDSKLVKYTGKNAEDMMLRIWDRLFSNGNMPGGDENAEKGRSDKEIFRTDNLEISIANDNRSDRQYVEMWGVLSNNNIILVHTPIESIRDNARIANRFFVYVGFITVAISGLVIFIISSRITKPIVEITNISEKMRGLDFEAVYAGDAPYELQQLGDNINSLSKTLKDTIGELKEANIQLTRDIEKSQELDEMRKEFVSNVSHELKTPIALIQGYAEGLSEGLLGEEQKDYYLDIIQDEATKMNGMVKKLITLNQMEFGGDTVSIERFDVVALVEGCVQSFALPIEQKAIELTYTQGEPIYVWGDEYKAEEVLVNYLQNAINHCSGDNRIDVKIEKTEDVVRVTVFNSGQPIPEEAIAHIWDKFYKVDKARTRAYGGSGIGLSIVKAVQNSLNQSYGVNNYDTGVAFYFTLDGRSRE